jgi:hypothetical protein
MESIGIWLSPLLLLPGAAIILIKESSLALKIIESHTRNLNEKQ